MLVTFFKLGILIVGFLGATSPVRISSSLSSSISELSDEAVRLLPDLRVFE